MNAERIERLAIDRRLGELNEDAAVLFDTYLAEHHEARSWARSMSDTCAKARQAIDSRTKDKDAGTGLTMARPHWRAPIRWAHVGRWAAVVAVSVGIGVTAGRWMQPPVSGPKIIQTEPAGTVSAGWAQTLGDSESSFWRGKALAMMKPQPYRTANVRDSQTSLWDRYRQFRKEPSYE